MRINVKLQTSHWIFKHRFVRVSQWKGEEGAQLSCVFSASQQAWPFRLAAALRPRQRRIRCIYEPAFTDHLANLIGRTGTLILHACMGSFENIFGNIIPTYIPEKELQTRNNGNNQRSQRNGKQRSRTGSVNLLQTFYKALWKIQYIQIQYIQILYFLFLS